MRIATALIVCLAGCGSEAFDTSTFAIRPDDPGAPSSEPKYDLNETVESWVSPAGRIRVHYSRAGRNAVPLADTDTSSVPDYVELVGASYDDVRALYHTELGLLEPLSDALLGGDDDGGDDRFDVYLVDFGGRGDGAYRREACQVSASSVCTGFMFQENDFAGYGYPSLGFATRVLASHEYFHSIQAAYDADQDSIFSESTAVWATEHFDPTLTDFEGFISSYLSRTERPLNVVTGGVVDVKSYGTAIFFQFLSERFGDEVIRELLEETVDGHAGVTNPVWFDRLDPYLTSQHGQSFADAFSTFSIWNLYTSTRANPAKSYQRGSGYPRVTFEGIDFPYFLDAPRFFTSSARYFAGAPEGRERITASLVSDEGADPTLRLYLTTVTGLVVADPVRLDDTHAGTQTIDVENADEVIVFVVNTAQDGNSARSGLCVGTVPEVEVCKRDAVPTSDAGVSVDAGDSDAGVADSGATGGGDEDEGCACVTSTRSSSEPLFLSLLMLVMLRRRRR